MAENKKNPIKTVILFLIVILVLIVAGFVGYTYAAGDINGSDDKTQYTLEISDNDYEYEVGQKLMKGGIVKSDALWTWWISKNYPDFVYYNGEYNLTAGMSYKEIAEKLQNPDVSHKKISICIPEGYNIFEIAKTLEENNICKSSDFLEACKSADGYDYEWLKDFPTEDKLVGYILEGFLFPATYDMGENSDAHDIVDMMLDAFDKRITSNMTDFCKTNNMSLYQFVTLSSIVQEEALNKESQGNIASVLINRLKSGAKLQCDVTYYYAKQLKDKGFSNEVYNAYYTYRCEGLPAGPIANPGEEIMKSVINHPDTDYLFFFSDLKGDFHFAATGDEFETLKSKYPWK